MPSTLQKSICFAMSVNKSAEVAIEMLLILQSFRLRWYFIFKLTLMQSLSFGFLFAKLGSSTFFGYEYLLKSTVVNNPEVQKFAPRLVGRLDTLLGV